MEIDMHFSVTSSTAAALVLALTACGGTTNPGATTQSALVQAASQIDSNFPATQNIDFTGGSINLSNGASNFTAPVTGNASFSGLAGYFTSVNTLVVGTTEMNTDFASMTVSGSATNFQEFSSLNPAATTAADAFSTSPVSETFSGTLQLTNGTLNQTPGTVALSGDFDGNLTRDSDSATIVVDTQLFDTYIGTNTQNGQEFISGELTGTVTSPEGTEIIDPFFSILALTEQ